MGNWIGETAGFAMLFLIGALFLTMLKEFRLIKGDTAARAGKTALYAFGSGFAYLSLGGLIYNASVGTGGIFEYNVVWDYGNYAKVMAGAESGECDGLFNTLYIKIAHLAGSVLFGQYLSATIYTSFLFAVLFALILYAAEGRLFGREAAESLLPFTFVWPFSYKLFLPSPVSLMCCLFGVIVVCALHAGWHRQEVKLRITDGGWGYQLALGILCAANAMVYYLELVGRR